MNFSTTVLSRFAATPGLKLDVSFEGPPGEGPPEAKREETKAARRERRRAEDLGTRVAQPGGSGRDAAPLPCPAGPPGRTNLGEQNDRGITQTKARGSIWCEHAAAITAKFE